MSADFAQLTAHLLVRVCVDLPFAIGMLRIAAWSNFFDAFELPVPTMRQSVGIALVLTALMP